MTIARFAVGMALAASLAAALSIGCSDVGDSSALPGDDATTIDSSVETDARNDGRAADAKPDHAEKDSTTNVETGSEGSSDASEETSLDSSLETGADATLESGSDSPADGGTDALSDGGQDSSLESGADAADTGSDAAPPAFLPCTTAVQTGCVQCTGNASDDVDGGTPLCTPTEAQIIASDVQKGLIDAAGPVPAYVSGQTGGSCYACLNAKGCLDDNLGDTGQECEDGAFSGGTTEAQCQATIACIFGTSCNAAALSFCYCGAATPSGTCTTDTTAVNDPVPASTDPNVIGGSCDVEIRAGLAHPIADGIDILKDFTMATLAAGRANAIFACGAAGKCAGCQ